MGSRQSHQRSGYQPGSTDRRDSSSPQRVTPGGAKAPPPLLLYLTRKRQYMSSWSDWLNIALVATLAIHFATGQGKVSAVLLIAEAVPVLFDSIQRIVKLRRR